MLKNLQSPSDGCTKQRSITLEKVLRLFKRNCGVRFTHHHHLLSPSTFAQEKHELSIIPTGTPSNNGSLPDDDSASPSKRLYQNTVENSIKDLHSLLSWWEDKTQNPDRDRCLHAFVKDLFRQVNETCQLKRYHLYQEHVSNAQQLIKESHQSQNHHLPQSRRILPRLPSIDDPPLNPLLQNIKDPSISSEKNTSGTTHASMASPLTTSQPQVTNTSSHQIQYLETTGAIKERKWKKAHVIHRPFMITGTHPPWPTSLSIVYLKSNFAVGDTLVPTHVPYFGDEDKDDVLSDLFDLDEWKKRGIHGPEYKKADDDNVLDQVLVLLLNWVKYMISILKDTNTPLSSRSNLTPCVEDMESCHSQILETIMNRLMKPIATAAHRDVEFINERYLRMIPHKESTESVLIVSSSVDLANIHKYPEKIKAEKIARTNWDYTDKYTTLMDSYRALFCRRCFSYDCNIHGAVYAPSLDLQSELACKKETDGSWDMDASWNPSNIADLSLTNELSDLEKLLLKRAYLIFQGNPSKISYLFRCNEADVQQQIQEQGLSPTDIMTVRLSSIREGNLHKKAKKGRSNETSLSKYDKATLKRAYTSEIKPSFEPCDHGFDPCTKDNCSCIQSALFCTKHCSQGALSKNFFRGCSCKAGGCRTISCSCFALGRECDPDVCFECGTCSDPPNATASKQQCRNDNISMRRHCHLLISESTIKDAGWGIFTKSDLKKGDFVHEYVGEMISQEEAERRGVVYDKLNRSFLFNLCSDQVLDASKKGNKTRYLNHSSDPNCVARIMLVNGDTRVGIFTKQNITAQSELFFDYRYDSSVDNDFIMKPAQTVSWMAKGNTTENSNHGEKRK